MLWSKVSQWQTIGKPELFGDLLFVYLVHSFYR